MKILEVILVIVAIILMIIIVKMKEWMKDIEKSQDDLSIENASLVNENKHFKKTVNEMFEDIEKMKEENKELRYENEQYKKLVSDLKIELNNCQGTQFYGNTKLALRRLSQVINDFEKSI